MFVGLLGPWAPPFCALARIDGGNHQAPPSRYRVGVFTARAGASSLLVNCESSAPTEFDERLQLEHESRWLDGLGLGNVVERALEAAASSVASTAVTCCPMFTM